MDEALQLGLRQKLDNMWASFFYEANIAFNVVRHPAFVNAVRETAAAGFLYQPPAYNAVRTKLIDVKKAVVTKMVSERTRNSISQYGATICSDGWSDTNIRPLMNIMLVCPAGDVFLGSVDSTGERKDIAYTTELISKYIDEVGPSNIVQMCTDNAAVMTGAMRSLEQKYPHMYRQGCAAHILDLLLEDWGKATSVKDLVKECAAIVHYIRKYQFTLALFRKASPNKALVRPVQTRFATNFLMIDRLVECKRALLMVVADDAYMEFEFSLERRRNGSLIVHRAKEVRERIHSEMFWTRCASFLYMVEPVLLALREFDGKIPAMPKAWVIMADLKKHVYNLKNPPLLLDPLIAARYKKQFEARWKLMLTDLHHAGALLNPFLADVVEVHSNGAAKSALNRVIRQLSMPLGVSVAEAMQELTQFEEKTGPFDPLLEAPDIIQCKLQPHQWWNRVGGNALPAIAKRVLGLTCSASSCERNWSMYSFVHNRVRNRLATSKAESLVYIYTNSKLEREKRGHNPALFYEKLLMDGGTEEEDQEPMSGGDEDEIFPDFMRANDNRREEEDRLHNNRWAAMIPPSDSPPRRHYPNTFAAGNVGPNSDEEEVLRSPEPVRVFSWDAEPIINSPPMRETTIDDNNEGINIPMPPAGWQAASPIPRRTRASMPLNLGSAAQVFHGSEQQEEPIHVDEVVREGIPVATIFNSSVSRATERTDYNSDAPLDSLLNLNCNVSLNRVGGTNVASIRRATPIPPPRPSPHRGPLWTTNEEVYASAPQPTQPSSLSDPRGSSLRAHGRKKGGKKQRMRTVDERATQNSKRRNRNAILPNTGAGCSMQNVGQLSREGRHPISNIDGITDALRLTKRLVQTEGVAGVDTQVRNLNSEIEREVQHKPATREDDENETSGHNNSSNESYQDTDPNADEVEGDSDYGLSE